MDTGREFALELGRVSRRWRTRLDEKLRHTGLTQARWIALLQLSQSGPISQRELAGRIGIEGPSLVRLLDNLERQNLIVRSACESDRRIKLVHLSKAARPLLEEITRISDGLRSEILADIPAGDLAVARAVLRSLADKLERH